MDSVIATASVYRVIAGVAVYAVVATVTVEVVIAFAARYLVIAIAAPDGIIARATLNQVVAAVTEELVISRTAIDIIVAIAAMDLVILFGYGHKIARCIELVNRAISHSLVAVGGLALIDAAIRTGDIGIQNLCIGRAHIDGEHRVIKVSVTAVVEIFKSQSNQSGIAVSQSHCMGYAIGVELVVVIRDPSSSVVGVVNQLCFAAVLVDVPEAWIDRVNTGDRAIAVSKLQTALVKVHVSITVVIGIAIGDDKKSQLISSLQTQIALCSRLRAAARTWQAGIGKMKLHLSNQSLCGYFVAAQ